MDQRKIELEYEVDMGRMEMSNLNADIEALTQVKDEMLQDILHARRELTKIERSA